MRVNLVTIAIVVSLLGCRSNNATPVGSQTSNSNNLVQLSNVQIFHSPSGGLFAGGLVSNNGNSSVSGIRIEINTLDENDKVLFSDIVGTTPESVSGHGKAIFLYPLDLLKGNPNKLKTSIVSVNEIKEKLIDVTVNLQKILSDGSGKFYLLGTFTNNGIHSLDLGKVAGIGYDNSGAVIAIGNQSVNSRLLASGDTTPFRIDLNSDMPIDSGDVLVQGVKASQIDQTSTSYRSTTNYSTFVDSNGFFHLIGEVENTGTMPINIGAIGSLFASDGTILDVAIYSAPFYYVIPGQSAPLDFSDFPIISGNPALAKTIVKYSVQTDYWNTRIFPGKILSPKINQTEMAINQNQITLTGIVNNDTAEDLVGVTIFARLKDKNGKLIGVGSTTLFDSIERDRSLKFTIYLSVNNLLEFNEFTVDYIAQSISSDVSPGQPSQP